jgi:hypothetical protein
MRGLRLTSLVLAVALLGATACAAAAPAGPDGPSAHSSRKKSCKKKSGARKKKCKRPATGEAETPLSVTITTCPTGTHHGSEIATVSGTAALGKGVTTYLFFLQSDYYFDTLAPQEVRVYPNASGAWTYSFTPGFPEGWMVETSWDERLVAGNGRGHDGVTAECSWTVIR